MEISPNLGVFLSEIHNTRSNMKVQDVLKMSLRELRSLRVTAKRPHLESDDPLGTMPSAKFSAGTPKICHSAMAKAPPPHLVG